MLQNKCCRKSAVTLPSKALDDFAQGGAMAAAEVRTDRGDRTMLDRIRENFVGAFYPWRMRFD